MENDYEVRKFVCTMSCSDAMIESVMRNNCQLGTQILGNGGVQNGFRGKEKYELF